HRDEDLALVREDVAAREGDGRKSTHHLGHLHLELRGDVREVWILGADAARPRTGERRTSAMALLPNLVPRGVNAAPSLAGLGKPRLEERIEDGLHPSPVIHCVRQNLVGEALAREVFLRRATLSGLGIGPLLHRAAAIEVLRQLLLGVEAKVLWRTNALTNPRLDAL